MSLQDVTFRFGPFRLERAAYRLLEGDEARALPPKVIDLLFLLVSRPANLISKDEILAALWADVAVTDNAITQVVSDLREALDDDAASPTYVQTVPRKGYRFIAPVEVVDASNGNGWTPAARRAPPEAGRAAQARAIAVLEFTNVSSDAEMGWLGAGLAETITSDLRAIADLRVIDRALVSSADRQPDVGAARALGLDLVVVGSFQRSAARLRITARAIDVATGAALVHAKADGEMADVFGLQDAIVRQLIAELRLTVTPAEAARLQARETSSLDAFRALSEGRMLLEALDPAEIPAAIGCFERALSFDPRYALAHCGLAHARFWRFQASRARVHRATDELLRAIAHAEQAIAIDPDLAEAHASLAFFLGDAGRPVEAVAAGRRAVALEPGNWRHLFRLGIAAWGDERLSNLTAVVTQFPKLAYAHFGIAMVHVARADLGDARHVLQRGIAWAASDQPGLTRFPASGLHWLLGLTWLAHDDRAAAQQAFEAELQSKGSRLFADEFAVDACEGLGMVRLLAGDHARAADVFEQALARLPQRPAALIGSSIALRATGAVDRADEAVRRTREAIDNLRQASRASDAAMATACLETALGHHDRAFAALTRLLSEAPPGHAGWSVPIEPLLAPLRQAPGYRQIVNRLGARSA
jgi:DNA-binding winged helix-turn-helix (wHTH) protein/Tfp pilus assembly protein PilF